LSSVTIYIDFASLTTNLLSSSGIAGIGEAPQLSSHYGEYDDGASVFNFYDNFAGTSLNTNKWTRSGTITVNNGLLIEGSSAPSQIETNSNYGSSVLDWYGYATVPTGGSGYWTNLGWYSNENNEQGNNWFTHDGSSYYGYGYVTTSSVPTITYTSTTAGSSPKYIFSTANDGTNAHYLLNYNAQSNTYAMQTTTNYIGFRNGASSSGGGADVFVQWVRVRAYSPNGVMPSVQFGSTQKVYEITFAESGLTLGTAWSVTLNGTIKSSTTNTITFMEPNGTYYYSTTPISGYTAPSLSGTISVYGSNVNVSISFTRVTYSVTFTESGLPYGTSWYVNISNDQSFTGSGTTITFNEPNGSYLYTIETSNKNYATNQPSGTFTVNGGDVNVAITFSPVTYTVTFIQNGLPSGTSWSITFNGITLSSTNPTITFNEPNGSYSYVISSISGYRTNTYSGTIIVYGNPVINTITWTVITYTITITENGIPNGTSWSATLTGKTFNSQYINVTLNSKTNTMTLIEPNGTYSYFVHMPFGYAGRTKGSITVSGQSVYINVLATSIITETTYDYIDLVTIAEWVMIIGVLGAAIAVIVRSR